MISFPMHLSPEMWSTAIMSFLRLNQPHRVNELG